MDYFYHQQSEMFAFYRIPRLLMTHERFKDMSCDAKLLYGVLLARMELSQKNTVRKGKLPRWARVLECDRFELCSFGLVQ